MTADPAAVETALRALFPAEVSIAVARIVPDTASDLWPEERAAIAGAVPTRVAEFAAGRQAARRALGRLGLAPTALPVAPDRSAQWPPGISGSIAHDAGLALAVARHGAPLGVDLEPDVALPQDLWSVICLPDELARLHGDRGGLARRIFCAKEAVFKAQPAGERAMFGFDAVAVTLAEQRFDAQFRTSVGVFRSGQVLSGRLATVDGVILAGVAWQG